MYTIMAPGVDIFASACRVLVNPVNCQGVMGAGLAKEFKRRFPAMFLEYREICLDHKLKIGEPQLLKGKDKDIIVFPTKKRWQDTSNLTDIEKGMAYLGIHTVEWQLESIAIPALGSGLGGLTWRSVLSLLVAKVASYPETIDVEIYPPLLMKKGNAA